MDNKPKIEICPIINRRGEETVNRSSRFLMVNIYT